MGQDIHTLFGFRPAAERFVENGVVGDPVRDDEAPFWAGLVVRQVPIGCQTDSGKSQLRFLTRPFGYLVDFENLKLFYNFVLVCCWIFLGMFSPFRFVQLGAICRHECKKQSNLIVNG